MYKPLQARTWQRRWSHNGRLTIFHIFSRTWTNTSGPDLFHRRLPKHWPESDDETLHLKLIFYFSSLSYFFFLSSIVRMSLCTRCVWHKFCCCVPMFRSVRISSQAAVLSLFLQWCVCLVFRKSISVATFHYFWLSVCRLLPTTSLCSTVQLVFFFF